MTGHRSISWVVALGCASPIGCAPSDDPGPRLAVAVAPLTLEGITYACYDLRVDNGLGQPVWSRGDPSRTRAVGDVAAVCSDAFGDGEGGGVTYVGPCDAGEPVHTVTLWVDSLVGAEPIAWRDPCPGGCALEATCVPNGDARVSFDLVIMRDARQGFFDLVIDFDDVFCSAKVDCTYDDAGREPITLLHDASGARGQTAVMAVACSAGTDAPGTVLHMNGPRVACAGSEGPPPLVLPLTCDAEGDLFGGVFGMTASGPVILPVQWDASATGEARAIVLPRGGYDGALVLQRVAPDELVGFVYSGSEGPGPSSTLRLAQWRRDGGGAWDLTGTIAGPDRVAFEAQPSYWDPATQVFWLGAVGADNGAPAVFFPRSADGTTFEPGRFLREPAGYARCELTALEGPYAIGRCAASSEPGSPNPAVRWDVSEPDEDVVAEVLVLPEDGGPGTSAYRTSWVGGLSDGAVIADIESGGGQHLLVLWREVAGVWVATPVGAPSPTPVYTGEVDDVVLGPDHVLGYTPASGTLAASPLLAGITGARVDGYDAELDLVYGRLGTIAGEARVFVAPRATLVPELLPLPAGLDPTTLTLELVGDASTPDALRVIYRATAGATERVVAWQIDAAPGGGLAIVALEPTAVLDPDDPLRGPVVRRGEGVERAHRALRPACDELIGSDVPPGAPGAQAARWGPFGAAGPVPPVFEPIPSAIAGGLPSWSAVLDPTIDGNAWAPPHEGDPVWQYAVTRGAEALVCDDGPCRKVFWSVLVGFDPARRDCRLEAEITASSAPGLAGGSTGAGRVYPIITVDVPLTDDTGRVCTRHPLGGSEVAPGYTTPSAPRTFCDRFDGASAASEAGCVWP